MDWAGTSSSSKSAQLLVVAGGKSRAAREDEGASRGASPASTVYTQLKPRKSSRHPPRFESRFEQALGRLDPVSCPARRLVKS